MRKPVVAVSIVTVLIVFLSLAQRLAQPAITGTGSLSAAQPETGALPGEHAAESPATAVRPSSPAPVPPSNHAVVLNDRAASPVHLQVRNRELRKSRKMLTVQNRLAASASSHAETTAKKKLAKGADRGQADAGKPYAALIGDIQKGLRHVRDYGKRGIGTPQWIESLSGPKALVPVRDFSDDKSDKSAADRSSGIVVPVASETSFAH